MSKHLWHFHSEVLKGFYGSEVYVVALDHQHAVDQAVMAYDDWLADQMGYHPLIEDSDPGDEHHKEQSKEARKAFKEEAIFKISIVPAGRAFYRRTG